MEREETEDIREISGREGLKLTEISEGEREYFHIREGTKEGIERGGYQGDCLERKA